MRILFVSKWLRVTGGVESYALAAAAGLRDLGHEVVWFGFGDGRQADFPVIGPLPGEFSLRHTGLRSALASAAAAVKLFVNPEVRRTYAETLARFRPDIVQLHNVFHHLGTRTQFMARKRGIPVVAYAHDYHCVCPNYTLLRGERTPCDARCGRGTVLHAVANRCVRRSLAKSALSALEFGLSKTKGAYTDAIDLWLSPSSFLARMLVQGGIPSAKVRHLEYPLGTGWTSQGRAELRQPHQFLYVGRLSYEKGVETMLSAARLLPDARFVIAGGGPQAAVLMGQAVGLENVHFVGSLTPAEVRTEMCRATALVVPSRWYENSPMVIREALASGLPVIASRIGGIPELVDDGVDGVLCDPGNTEQFAAAMRRFLTNPGLSQRMGAAGTRKARDRWDVKEHAQQLLTLYWELRSRRSASTSADLGV